MSRTVRIIPAILANEPPTLEKLVRQAESFTDYAQLDFMDGLFVPSNSVSCHDTAVVNPKIGWEAHLMVLQPENCLEDFRRAGAQKIIFHYEAVASPVKMVSLIKELGLKVGMAINPETSFDSFKAMVPELDSVLFMSVNPGFYGAKFIPEVLDKIKIFRRTYFRTQVGIDGGMKESNVADAVRAGADDICVGSAIFNQPDPGSAYRKLKELAQAALV